MATGGESAHFLHGTKLTHLDKMHTCDLIASVETVKWWQDHGHFSEQSGVHVNWDAVGDAMSRLFPQKRRWVTEHTSGNCSVGSTSKNGKH